MTILLDDETIPRARLLDLDIIGVAFGRDPA